MSPFRPSRALALLAAAALAGAGIARADIAPEPSPGHRLLKQGVVVDPGTQSGDQVLLARGRPFRRDGVPPLYVPEPVAAHEPIVLGGFGGHIYSVDPEVAARRPTVQQLRELGVEPAVAGGPPDQEVPIGDRRVQVERRWRLSSAAPVRLEILDDVFKDASGAIVCRRPALDEEQIHIGQDPCDPEARTKRFWHFVRSHLPLLATAAAAVALLGAALGARALRRRRGKRSE